MSNLSIRCDITLSKKLRALLGDSGVVNLILTGGLEKGKGSGTLSFSSDVVVPLPDIEALGETSIMLVPNGLADELPSSRPAGAIFSTGSIEEQSKSNKVIRKIATVKAPTDREIRQEAKKVPTPAAFKELDNPACQNYINSLEKLIEAVNVAKTNEYVKPDLTGITNPRERAIALAEMEKSQSIPVPAFVVNEKAGMIAVNDLGIDLPMNSPYNLANISASRLAQSSDLRGLIRSGIIKFISPNEIQKYVDVDVDTGGVSELRVFSSPEEAEAAIGTGSQGASSVLIDEEAAEEFTANELEKATEEESMILNLTQNMGDLPDSPLSESGVRVSSHGAVPKASRPVVSPNPNIKTVMRKE